MNLRRLLIIALAVPAIAGCRTGGIDVPQPQGPSKWDKAISEFYDPSVIPEIHIHISEDEWNRLLEEYDKDSNNSEYFHSDINIVRGGYVSSVQDAGIRLRGNTSRRRPESSKKHAVNSADWHHCHFSVNTHKFYEKGGPEFGKISRFDLKWFKDDPSYVREIYCYDLFRRFGVWTAINSVYSRLYLKVSSDTKEAYFGVYELMEHIDEDYLKARSERFGSSDGYLWKCRHSNGIADLTNADDRLFGVDDNVHSYAYEYKSNPESFSKARDMMKDFIQKTGTLSGSSFMSWISSVMDVDLFLRTYAVNVAVGMWDDFWNNGNNYYLYFVPSGGSYKVYFIPFDYDNTLGTSLDCGVQSDAGRQDPYRWGRSENNLMTKLLQNSEWKVAYRDFLRQLCLAGGLSSFEEASSRIRGWQGMIRDYVSNDTGEDMTISDRPAPWGNHGEYRILSDGSDNFFKVKAAAVSAMK